MIFFGPESFRATTVFIVFTLYKDVIQLNLINITNITIPINNPHTTINFNNDIQLPNNSYITPLSLLADAKIHNITSTQIVVIDGAQIIFNPGT